MAKIESYIPNHHVISAAKADYLDKLFDSEGVIDRPSRQLGVHIFNSYQYQYEHMDGVPIPYETYSHALPGANPFLLEPLIEISGYRSGNSRKFLPLEPHWGGYLGATANLSPVELKAAGYIDYDTGRRANKAPLSRKNDRNNNPQPQVTMAAIDKLTANGIYFLANSLESYHQEFKSRITQRDVVEKTELYRQFKNADSCRTNLHRYNQEHVGNGIYRLKQPAWYAQDNGRLYIVGGCLQSANGNMKRAAYNPMPGFGNYDIVSCHVFVAIVLMQQARINTQPLIDYYYEKSKERYAEAIGISTKHLKLIVLALLNGAYLPKPNSIRRCDIVDYLAKDVGTDLETLTQALRRCWTVLEPIYKCIKKWHSHLLNKYIDAHKVKGGNGFLLPNELGKFLPLWELDLKSRKRWNQVGKIASHLMVGYEQACIQEQIVLDENCKFCSCEHDGFTTMDSKPDTNLWQQITERHGMGGMQLVSKLI
jgi:hypothetical protein